MTAKSKVQTGPARCFQKHKAREGGKWRHFEGNCGIFANWRLIDLTSPKSILFCDITIQFNALPKNYQKRVAKHQSQTIVPCADRKYMDYS